MLLCSAPLVWAADFLLSDIDGKPYRLSDFRGKWVVVNYFATWCPPCLEEIPEIAVFHEKHKGEIEVVGINFEKVSKDKLRAFIDGNLIDYPVLRADPTEDPPVGSIKGLPTTLVVGPDGQIKRVHLGAITRKELERYTRSKR